MTSPNTDPGTAPASFLKRNRLWLVPILVVAAILGWRAMGSGNSEASFGPERAATPVRAAAVTRGDLELVATYAGEIVGEVSDIAPEVAGTLDRIAVRIGDPVRRGQVLAEINDVNLRNQAQEARGQQGVASANERRAAAELESATSEHRRAKELKDQALLSEQEFDRVSSQLASSKANLAAAEAQSEQAKARLALLDRQLSESRVTAPFDGVVADRYLDRGVLVQPGTPILRLVQAGQLRVQFRVPERDLGAVRIGVPFESTTVATGDETFIGTVERVAGEVSRSDRTALVEGALGSPDDVLRPGMYAEVRVQVKRIDNSLVVPSTAVLDRIETDGSHAIGVFVAQRDVDTASWVDVRSLGNSLGRTAIEGDLNEGELVLTMGHSDLRDGAAINIVQIEGEPMTTSSAGRGPAATGGQP
jgi:RND family efflux transporter MFP subunit